MSEERTSIGSLYTLNSFITNTEEFNTLDGKTQVFDQAVTNLELKLTTRMMHIRSVAELARDIAIRAGISYEKQLLAETIGISHDIGHTPFGHKGERILNEEVQKFGLNYEFKHEQYGASIFDEIFERFLEYCKTLGIQIDEEYMEQIREEIRVGIINHNQYYAYKVSDETMAQKCVRLADFIAFIISDLSDLSKYNRIPQGKGLIEDGIKEKICNELHGVISKEELEQMMVVLEKGGAGIARIRSNIVDEIIDNKPTRGDLMTMRDEYKILKDMKDSHNSNNIASLIQNVFDYYEYLTMYSDTAIGNDDFVNEIAQIIGETEPKHILQKLKGISERDKDLVDKLINVISRTCITQLNRIISEEIINVPTLATIFTMQNIQYADIVIKKDAALGNEQNDDKLRDRFYRIIKMAYFANRKKEKKQTLESYRGKKVPRFGEKRFKPLEYTVFAIQQMRNQDFEDERIIELIMQELGIADEEKATIDEIDMEEIYEAARQERDIEQRYSVDSIVPLTENNAGIGMEAITEVLNTTIQLARANQQKEGGEIQQ